MSSSKVNDLLIPNVSKLRKSSVIKKSPAAKEGDFQKILKKKVDTKTSVDQLKLSVHAQKRVQEREIGLDGQEFMKLQEAMIKLRMKGSRDSLVITDKAAYIVDVPNNIVVTAMKRDEMAENVFTKIDSTLVVR